MRQHYYNSINEIIVGRIPHSKEDVDKLEGDQRRIMWMIWVLSFNGSLKTLHVFNLYAGLSIKINSLNLTGSIDFRTVSGTTYSVNNILELI